MKKTDGDEYLSMYPKLRKWINECVMCHSKGIKPNLPDEIYTQRTAATSNLKKYFKTLEVDSDGLCDTCKRII